jgi:Cu-processing system permease protein
MVKIFKYSFSDLIRSRWSLAYFGFYLITAVALLYLSTDLSRAVASLMNVVIILSPLIGMLFGVMYYYNSREFIELLLAQPIKRSSIFLGQYFGLAVSLSLSFFLGILLPFIFIGSGEIKIWLNFITLIVSGVFLTFIFSALAYFVSIRHENKIKGFATAIALWLFMAVIYDGIFLLLLVFFNEYPTDKLALGIVMLNPVDQARILMMLKLDISAIMGYTGAVFQNFFGTSLGMTMSLLMSALWVIFPVWGMIRYANRKDF